MKKLKVTLLAVFILFNGIVDSGCWNYREIDHLAIVAGVAVDKGTTKKFSITVEIVEPTGEKEAKKKSSLISMEGDSIFDAVRNTVSASGKRLYWTHAKVLIISEEIAREGVLSIIDWFNRDAETRSDVHILISKEASAKNILEGKGVTEDVLSYELDNILREEKSVSKAPMIEIWQFTNDISAEGTVAIAPTVKLDYKNGNNIPVIIGTAVFKRSKLIGFLSGDETKDMLFIQNKIKGGILTYNKHGGALVTLEIFKSRTKVKPVVDGDNIEMNVNVYTDTAIDEIECVVDYVEEPLRKILEQEMGKMQEDRMKQLIEKIQQQFKVDIFGFGEKLRKDEPQVWKQIGDWSEVFPELTVNVKATVHIRNSAMLSKPLKVGE